MIGASPNPWLQTASGRAFDLLDPRPETVDLTIDVPEALARLPRFTGHIRSGPYSVAQHCVLGADALYAQTTRRDVALAFLLHDAHEAYLGDVATPIAAALAQTCDQLRPSFAPGLIVRAAQRLLKQRIDTAIYAAVGAPYPLPDETTRLVAIMDLRMLAAERAQLLGRAPKPWDAAVEAAQPAPLKGAIKPWPWPKAADAWRARLALYAPKPIERAA